jgi:hypothetical protein
MRVLNHVRAKAEESSHSGQPAIRKARLNGIH